jgi:fibronectin type 3 domain-containing protein
MKMKKYIVGLVFICMAIISLMLTGCGGNSGSAPASATPSAPATVIPPPPTGIVATGGPTQVTISWDAAPGATSYNIYWFKSPGGATPVWTRIANATSPYVQTGLDAGAIYNYVVTAVNSAGESSPSSQVFAWTNSLPTAPTMVVATGGSAQVTLTWNPVQGATSYNLYWSTDPGVLIMVGGDTADPLPIKIANITSPYIWNTAAVNLNGVNQSGGSIDPATFVVTANTTYYFVVTAVTSAGEVPSQEVSATTL